VINYFNILSIFDFGNALIAFVQYVLLIPYFLLKLIEFLFEVVRLVPGIFGIITLVFLPFYVGIFVWKLFKG